MKLSEITFNRDLIKAPHPVYERFWLVSWIKLSPADIKVLWVFKNEQELQAARSNHAICDLIMDRYPGDYLVTFKSENGVFGMAVVSFEYVSRHGNGLVITGASFTEKSAWDAAKRATEEKGHRWDPNLYSLLSVVPSDPSIFKLDRDEDIDHVSEGLGADVLRFADYVASTKATPQAKKDMNKLASELFRRGFELPDFGNVRLNKDEDEMAGFGFSFVFPDEKDGHQRAGILTVIYTTFKENSAGELAMHRWTSHYSAAEILAMGLDRFMDHARRSARHVK